MTAPSARVTSIGLENGRQPWPTPTPIARVEVTQTQRIPFVSARPSPNVVVAAKARSSPAAPPTSGTTAPVTS